MLCTLWDPIVFTRWLACSGNLETWEPSQHLLLDTGKPKKTCVEVAGRRRRWPVAGLEVTGRRTRGGRSQDSMWLVADYNIIILTIVLQLSTVFSTVTCCTGL